jgi:hypothetical protein
MRTKATVPLVPLVLLAVQGLATPACAQDDVFWISPVSGLWSEASNWSSAPVPGLPGSENRRVNIALAGTYTVDLDFNATISGIELINSDATLRFSGPSGALTTTGDNRFTGANIAGSGSNTLTTGGLTVFSGGATLAGISAANFGGRTEFTGDDIDLCDTCVFLTGDSAWTGGGSFNLENDSMGSEIVIETGGSLELTGAGARTIRGIGANNRVVNRGELRIALDAGADALAITDSQFQNVRGASVRIETGTLQSNLSGSLSGNSLRGGDWFVGDAGTVDTMGVQIEAIDVAVELDGAGSAFDAVNALERVAGRGALRVKNGRDFATAAGVAFSVEGELEVGDGSAFMVTDSLANLGGGTLQGGSFIVGGELGLMNGGAIGTLEAGLTLEGAGTVSDGSGGDLLAGLARVGVDGVFALRSGAAFTTASDLDLDGTLDIGAGSAADVRGNLSAFQAGVFGDADLRVRGELVADNSRVEAVEGALLVGLDGRILARNGAGTVDGLSFLRQVRVGGSVELAEGRDLDVRAAGNTVEIEGDLILGATGGAGPTRCWARCSPWTGSRSRPGRR